ncbi:MULTISPECIES: hypothetical protein [Cyanophyceae]|uniref:hypothetical protein n=1 Tax=Cyanophyceae TaxID=3028117 RepID=UPI00232AB6BB|nr:MULTISPECIES: hypothetical protein [Cyanophyceae]MDB9358357.1 hypothetical protein [Nodularia spumigena CS-587/03]MDB9340228.1 hypothetical protein [Nodularia spumigena CS-589/07]MDB9399685.1 hypothetical protein [Microcystis aeruginosa CS-567/02-A1]MDB9501168.1 hypothetical protein [Nodularia spumigena CS-336/02]MDB9532464.1 hypothetical protein [Nodularia spumigena CS-1038]
MINDQELLHGAALMRLVDHGERLTISHASWIHSSIYLVETETSQSAILFKVSKKPKSAWPFTLSNQEELALDTLHSKYQSISVFLAFICHKDGICCISEERLWTILDKNSGIAGQHISMSRKTHGSYHISGPGRQQMDQTVPQNDWPRVLFSN